MKISKVEIKNFRLLKDVVLDLEDELSLVIGKNNCGKTSLLLLLERFLGKGVANFSFEDLNLDVGRELASWIRLGGVSEDKPKDVTIRLILFISYDKNDNLSNIGDTVLMDLDPNNSTIVLSFEYVADSVALDQVKAGFIYETSRRKQAGMNEISATDFLISEHGKYFKTCRKSVLFDVSKGEPDFSYFTDLDKEKIKLDRILRFKSIGARRDVSNKESDNTLSAQSAKEYDRIVATDGESEEVEAFKDSLIKADKDLDDVYGKLFEGILNDVAQFGGVRKAESEIKIVSSLRSNRLLKDNTIVKYSSGYDGHDLPENHNGLGYLNLISMVFELRAVLQDFAGKPEIPPADINLLFIEEPEAHTHPQLQYVFIKNIKELLKGSSDSDKERGFDLQTVISTHSPHIVSESDFNDIKYLRRDGGEVKILNLKSLEGEYDDPSWFKFLKQYLTIHRSELFFADKAIFIEGDTERVLMPAMIAKVDHECRVKELLSEGDLNLPLQSQNISVVEVGNYFLTFERFVRFIGLKCLVITDIDGGRLMPVYDKDGNPKQNKNGKAKMKEEICKTSEASLTSNNTLNKFFKIANRKNSAQFNNLRDAPYENKLFARDTSDWYADKNGTLRLAFQTPETNGQNTKYHARSFEDAFLHVNYELLKTLCTDGDGKFTDSNLFPSIVPKHLKKYLKDQQAYEMADKGIKSKPSFAIEVLFNSIDGSVTVEPHSKHSLPAQTFKYPFSNWNSPEYIREGLIWLRQD